MDLASILEARRAEIYEEYLEKTASSDVLERLKGYYNKAVDSTERNIIRPVADKLRGIGSDGFSAVQRSSLRSHHNLLARKGDASGRSRMSVERPRGRGEAADRLYSSPRPASGRSGEDLQSSVSNESARAEREWAQQSNRNIAVTQKGMHGKANSGRRTVQIKSPTPKKRIRRLAPAGSVGPKAKGNASPTYTEVTLSNPILARRRLPANGSVAGLESRAGMPFRSPRALEHQLQ